METGLDHREKSHTPSILWCLIFFKDFACLHQVPWLPRSPRIIQPGPFHSTSWCVGNQDGTPLQTHLRSAALCEARVFDRHALHFHLASDCSAHVGDVALMQTLHWRKEEK